MKWLKRIAIAAVALIALTVGGLLAAGHRAGAGHNHAQIVIDRPAAGVFGYLTDYDQVKRWVPMLRKAEFLRGEKIEPGAVARLSMEGAIEDEEIVALEPPRRLKMKLTGTGGEFEEDCEYALEEAGGKTTLRVDADTRYHGAFALLEPVITPAADQAQVQMLQKLKALAEKELAP